MDQEKVLLNDELERRTVIQINRMNGPSICAAEAAFIAATSPSPLIQQAAIDAIHRCGASEQTVKKEVGKIFRNLRDGDCEEVPGEAQLVRAFVAEAFALKS